MPDATTLWYFADPMCSWCWGFTSVIEKIRDNYQDRFSIALILGGLRPGTTEPVSEQMRDEIFHHWHQVHAMTGQEFSFQGAMPTGFVYDTEPACRAVVTVANYESDSIFQYFKSIQSAFYVDQIDVTRKENLAEIAENYAVSVEAFNQYFNGKEARQKTLQHFQTARQAGVTGFPSLILQRANHSRFIARGWTPYEELQKRIESWLEK